LIEVQERTTLALGAQFDAAGGLSAVAAAGGQANINATVVKALNGDPRDAGFVLLTLFKLSKLHPDKMPSLSNAAQVLSLALPVDGGIGAKKEVDDACGGATSADGGAGAKATVKKRELMQRYENHRGIAPFFAAAAAEIEATEGRIINPAEFQEHLRELLLNGRRRERMMCWMMTLQRWAMEYRPKHAKHGQVVLPSRHAIEFLVTLAGRVLQPQEVDLLPLAPAALELANRAPITAKGRSHRTPRPHGRR
jgi:hypothetical protein